jgi:hypothetical protein
MYLDQLFDYFGSKTILAKKMDMFFKLGEVDIPWNMPIGLVYDLYHVKKA